jgi:hypothetical protein
LNSNAGYGNPKTREDGGAHPAQTTHGQGREKEKAANVSLILLKIILGIGKRGRLMILGWRKGGAWDSVAPPERSVKL